MRRALALGLVTALAGCGGHRVTVSPTTAHRVSWQSRARVEVTATWLAFFNEPAARAPLLQRSAAFGGQLAALGQSVLARRLTARVSNVAFRSPRAATVTYTLLLGRKPVLQNATGTAVRVQGRWRVGVASFCRLLALAGSTPKACP